MCGRYTLVTLDGFEPFFEINDQPDLVPRYNVAPSQDVPVIAPGREGRGCGLMRWGLIPHWSRGERPRSWINARSETVDRLAAFKESFARRRCLIPADGFYEWIKGTPKRPVHFRLADGGLFAFAGVWDRWREAGGEQLLSCAILTAPSNALVEKVHDRMPVMLDREQFGVWLDREAGSDELRELLRPYPEEGMAAVEVSRFVNNAFNEGPECLLPVAPGE